MTMLQCTVQAAISATSVLATSSLPAAIYGSKVCSRTYSQAQHQLHREKEAGSGSRSQKYAWAFPPAARELVREAGGFAGGRRWPRANGSSLLDRWEVQHPSASPLSLRRHYSIIPKSAEPPSSTHTVYTAALDLPKQQLHGKMGLLQDSGCSLSQWISKTKPRMKGFTRKLVLRQANRRIVARVARRLTIGIPILGFYFVSKLMVKDLERVKLEYAAGNVAVAALFATALSADVLDLAAQFTVITGLAHANLGVGLASAAAMLALADKASLITAGLSFTCGLGGELAALHQLPAEMDEKPE